MVPILENYKDYDPPAYVRPVVERLLAHVQPNHLAGLQSVVLTNAAVIGKGKTKRVGGRKHPRNECRGFYHRKWNNQQPWIEIVVDNTLSGMWQPGNRIPIFREFVLADVLYHEVGHHLDLTLGSPARGGEDPANMWSKRLGSRYLRHRYWYLIPIFKVLSWTGILPKTAKPH
jgi:hypothetical protein